MSTPHVFAHGGSAALYQIRCLRQDGAVSDLEPIVAPDVAAAYDQCVQRLEEDVEIAGVGLFMDSHLLHVVVHREGPPRLNSRPGRLDLRDEEVGSGSAYARLLSAPSDRAHASRDG